jgi:hypothetical protein
MDWFRERGLTEKVTVTVRSEMQRIILSRSRPDIEIGDTFERDEVVMSYSGGRIDIRGVSDEPWGLEYGLPLMRTEDWNDFSDWLESFQTHELWEFDDIIKLYESASGRKIRWWKEDE